MMPAGVRSKKYLAHPWEPKGVSWKYPVTNKDQLRIIEKVIEWGKNWRSKLQKAVYRVDKD